MVKKKKQSTRKSKTNKNNALSIEQAIKAHVDGNLTRAEKEYLTILTSEPNNYVIAGNLGTLYLATGRFQKAARILAKAVEIKPDYAQSHSNLGNALQALGQLDQAILSFHTAVSLEPKTPEWHFNLGNALFAQEKTADAVLCYRSAINLRDHYPEAYTNLGNALKQQEKLDDAITCYRAAIKRQPRFTSAHANLGICLQEQGHGEEAIQCYRRALSLQANNPEVHCHLGNALTEQGELIEAIQCYRNAIKYKPDFPGAHYNLSMTLLLNGEWQEGWHEYEWRLKRQLNSAVNNPNTVMWDGDFAFRRELILSAEQGLGDVFQFMRYGILLKQKMPHVSISVPDKLVKIIEQCKIFDRVYSQSDPELVIDNDAQWVPMLSVPGLLGVPDNADTEPLSYIQSNPSKDAQWNKVIHTTESFVVGINWQGNPKTERGTLRGRSFTLAEFAPLAQIDGVQLLSLQKGDGAEQLEDCSFRDNFISGQNKISDVWDFIDTAAIMMNCHLIITSDTYVAHLAGGLGIPCWILLHKIPEWRWGLAGEKSRWYPNIRLFRQHRDGDWAELMQRVTTELKEYDFT